MASLAAAAAAAHQNPFLPPAPPPPAASSGANGGGGGDEGRAEEDGDRDDDDKEKDEEEDTGLEYIHIHVGIFYINKSLLSEGFGDKGQFQKKQRKARTAFTGKKEKVRNLTQTFVNLFSSFRPPTPDP